MRLSFLASTSLALPALAHDPDRVWRRNGVALGGPGGRRLVGQVVEEIRSRILRSDGLGLLERLPAPDGPASALWRRPKPTDRRRLERSVYDYGGSGASEGTDDADALVEPDVGILSPRHLEETPSAGQVNEYSDLKFCDLFLELRAFENLVCDCQNSPRAKVSCRSPKVCYHSVEPNVCLMTAVDMVPRQDGTKLNIDVCYTVLQPTQAEYCFVADMDYRSFFLGNETIYDSCTLTVDGQTCDVCEITSRSQNDQNCTGLADFDCRNTAAGTSATDECSTFYSPFPEIYRIADIVSGGGGVDWRHRTRLLGTGLLMTAALTLGSAVL